MLYVWLATTAVIVFLAANLAWRYASRRRSLPCPTWLAWSLENSISDLVTGTRVTLDRMALRPGQRVLEVGPGPGRLLIPAARRVLPEGQVVGLDIQPGMLDRLRTRAQREAIANLTLVQGDAARPHFAAESFDVVFLCTVLGEIPDRQAALRECFALLRPGGQLSITEIIGDPHYQSRRTVERLAEAAGFRLREVQGRWYRYTANFIKPA